MPRSAAARTTVFIASQPSWALKAALTAAMVVITMVAMVIIIPALFIGALVLIVASMIARVRFALGQSTADRGMVRSEGRRNVRVIVRDDPQQ